ncbi:MAG: hypothetical protein ACFNNL_03095 [Kingella oralis]
MSAIPKPLILTALLLVALLSAPSAQAKLPAHLNDCKAHAQNIVQVYAVAIACEKTQDADLEELVTRFAPANEDYLEACEKLGMTREMEKAWFKAEENKVERLLASRYKISPSDSDKARAQKIAAYCQDEQPRLKQRLQQQFKSTTP